MGRIIKFFASLLNGLVDFLKRIFGLPLRLVLLALLIDLPVVLVLYLALQGLTAGQNRLEQDLVIVEDTQVKCLQLLTPKSATPSGRVVVQIK